MKNIITLILLLFIVTACTKKEEQNKNISETSPKEQVEQTIDNVTDNVTTTTDNNIQEKKLPEIEYWLKTTIDKPENPVQLNKVDMEQLLLKYYETDKIKAIKRNYEIDPYNALEMSLQYGYFDVADELLKGVKLDKYLKNLLIGSIAIGGKIENLKYLEKYNVRYNYDVNDAVMQVYGFSTNKFLAYKMAEYLLQNTLDPNASDGYTTPLIDSWNKASIDLLLKYGADLEFVGYLGDDLCGTYLLDSAIVGNKALVDYLLSIGANPFSPVSWHNNEYGSSMICGDKPIENIGSLYKLLYEDMELGDKVFDKSLISDYKESIQKYSKNYIIDAYAIADEYGLYQPFMQEEMISLTEYMAQFETGDFEKNYTLLSNVNTLSKDLNLYYDNKKMPYIYALLNSRFANEDNIHLDSIHAYLSVLISNGFNMGEDTKDTNVLDYIFSQISRLEFYESMNYISSYIYRQPQDKKKAVNNLMKAVKKANITPDQGYIAEYIYRMYDKYNK